MKNKLKSIYKKYNNIKYSLLKNLNNRKTKIQVIWNQINSPNKENKLKTKKQKSKPNNQKVLFSNFEFSKLSFPKNFSNFSIKCVPIKPAPPVTIKYVIIKCKSI